MEPSEIKISIIMTAFNEEANIENTYKELKKSLNELNITHEIILVNDGSNDNTGKICIELSKNDPNITFINNDKNVGIGSSFWNAGCKAKGEYVIWFASDGENFSYEILRYIHLLDHVDILVPFAVNKNTRTLSRRLISSIYKMIINFSFRMFLNYTNGSCVYKKSVFLTLNLQSKGFFFQTELLVKSIKAGYLYAEIPFFIKQRPSGEASAISFKNLINVTVSYFNLFFNYYFNYASKNLKTKFVENSVTFKRWRDKDEL